MILRSVASRLALWVLLGSSLVLVAIGAVLLAHTRERLLTLNHRASAALTREAAARIQARLERVTSAARTLSVLVPDQADGGARQIREILLANYDLTGIAVAYGRSTDGTRHPAPFVTRLPGGALRELDLGANGSYWNQAWFARGLQCLTGCWQRSFLSRSRHQRLINYSVAIPNTYDPPGLVNIDVSLDWIQDLVDRLDLAVGAHAYVLDGQDRFVASDDPAGVGRVAPAILRAAHARARNGRAGTPVPLDPGDGPGIREASWAYFMPIEQTDWAFALVVPERRVYAALRRSFVFDMVLGGLGLLGIALVLLAVMRRTLAPLGALARGAEHVARGELDLAMPALRGADEVARLGQAFERMRRDLGQHLRELERVHREQQRLASELEIASQIQMSLLPGEHYRDTFTQLELEAVLRPARSVGGDLYTWFQLDDTHFCVMVGDVSDKGIPAALFMARTVTLAMMLAPRSRAPEQILALLNRELCRNNDSCMFATLLCCVLELGSGRLALASAGHEPPLLCGDGAPRLIELETGAALGLDEEATYPAHALTLEEGRLLLMYTDGVTEALDRSQRLFGSDGLLSSVAAVAPPRADACVRAVLAAVDAHAEGVQQADDITIVALSRHAAPAAAMPSHSA